MAVSLLDATTSRAGFYPSRFERKYYLRPEKAGLALALLKQVCVVDKQYPSEQISSLYFDTTGLDQHDRSADGDFRKDKVRIRWYGETEYLRGPQTVFLELKSRRGFASTKHRSRIQVPAEALAPAGLRSGIVPEALFYKTLASFGYFPPGPLQPVIKISYWRHRFCDLLSSQRISLDCRIRSTMITPSLGNGERELELPGAVIEVKGSSTALSAALARMRMLEIDWGGFSKYSACIDSHLEAPGTAGRLAPSGRI
jgi:hypothetical protein